MTGIFPYPTWQHLDVVDRESPTRSCLVTLVVQPMRVVRNFTFHLPVTRYSGCYSHGVPQARVCLPRSTIPPRLPRTYLEHLQLP